MLLVHNVFSAFVIGKRIRQLNGGKKEHWPDILTEHEEYEMRVLEQEQSCIHGGRALSRIQVCGCLLCYCLFGLLHSFSK